MATEIEIMNLRHRVQEDGYKVEGSEQSWFRAFSKYNYAQLMAAADALQQGHGFKTVLPSHLITQLRQESFQGAGEVGALDPSKWVFWKQHKITKVIGGRHDGEEIDWGEYEYAHHPSLPPDCKGPNE